MIKLSAPGLFLQCAFLGGLVVSGPVFGKSQLWGVTVLGDRRGEVEPCGCPKIQLGGVNRLISFQATQRKDLALRLVLESGNTFFEIPQLPPRRQELASAKAELIADAYRQMGVDVMVPGPRDLALGKEAFEKLAARAGLKAVAANWLKDDGSPVFAPYAIVEKAGVKIGVTGLANESAAPGLGKLVPARGALESVVEELRKKSVDAVVLIAQHETDLENLRSLAFDIVVVPPQEGGKSVNTVTWDSKTKEIIFEKHDLGPQFGKSPAFASRYEEFQKRVRGLAVDRATVFVPKDKGAFVSQAGTCLQCHEEQYRFWEATKHASAYLVLYSDNQHFNPECIGCHSLGYGTPAGFQDITAPIRLMDQPRRKSGETPFVEKFMKEVFEGDTKGALDSRLQPERYAVLKKKYHEKIHGWQKEGKIESLSMGVQCEHCHGNRSAHPGKPSKAPSRVQKSACLQCHVPPRDESFVFAQDLKQVACPKMKKPRKS